MSRHCGECGARTGEHAEARVVDRKAEGSCCFCSRGTEEGFPYRKVLLIRSPTGGGATSVRICRACFKMVKAVASSAGF